MLKKISLLFSLLILLYVLFWGFSQVRESPDLDKTLLAPEADRMQEELRAKPASLAAEQQRQQEAAMRQAEAARLAEQQRQQEEARRLVEAARLAEQLRQQEEARRLVEAARLAEQQRQQEEAMRRAEAARLAAEQQRQQEAMRRAEPARLARSQEAEARMQAEAAARLAEQQRQQQEARMRAAARSSSELTQIRAPSEPTDRENYAHFDDNPVKRVSEHPVSTFSIDVDTGSYTNVRRMLNYGQLPPHDAVRVEEMINYFAYDYPLPDSLDPPFKVTTEIAPTPWNQKTHLLHLGIKGYSIPKDKLPPANLVFLVDVSGSMQSRNKLDLLKSTLKLLTQQLTAKDKVSLVVYAGASGLVLEPTPGNQRGKILAALARLSAGGSTNGGAGIQLAYAIAEQAFIKNGINRVLLATDGDFNVGTVNFEALKNLIEEKRKTGISLTTLGFGTGNYNDHLMEQLADAGNGNYAYIDNLNEAQKVLVDEMSSTLNTIAKDVKIQIEFNPATVAEYRLIGYENRMLKREDFSNDKIDAGEIGAGHTVTALYEIALVGSGGERLENLRYGDNKTVPEGQRNNELAFLRLRYKAPDGDTSQLIESPLKRQTLDNTSERYRFSAAVAAFGQQLRGGKYLEQFSYNDILNLARGARGEDPFGYRAEFIKLVNLAQTLGSK
jgi:Ca-activated chloride channel family protein